MKKQYRKLTEEQRLKGVIFSSQFIGSENIHEVFKDDKDKEEHIRRLKDDKFFNGSPWSINEIRQ